MSGKENVSILEPQGNSFLNGGSNSATSTPTVSKTTKVIDHLHSEIDVLKESLEKSDAKVKEYKQKYDVVVKRSQQMIENLTNTKHENDMMNSMLQRKDRRIKDLEEQLTDLISKVDSMEFDHRTKEAKLSKLQDNERRLAAEHEVLKMSYDALIRAQKDYKAHYDQEVSTLKTNFRDYLAERQQTLNDNVDTFNSNNNELDELFKKMTNKSSKLEVLYKQKNNAIVELLKLLLLAAKDHGNKTIKVLNECEEVLKAANRKLPTFDDDEGEPEQLGDVETELLEKTEASDDHTIAEKSSKPQQNVDENAEELDVDNVDTVDTEENSKNEPEPVQNTAVPEETAPEPSNPEEIVAEAAVPDSPVAEKSPSPVPDDSETDPEAKLQDFVPSLDSDKENIPVDETKTSSNNAERTRQSTPDVASDDLTEAGSSGSTPKPPSSLTLPANLSEQLESRIKINKRGQTTLSTQPSRKTSPVELGSPVLDTHADFHQPFPLQNKPASLPAMPPQPQQNQGLQRRASNRRPNNNNSHSRKPSMTAGNSNNSNINSNNTHSRRSSRILSGATDHSSSTNSSRRSSRILSGVNYADYEIPAQYQNSMDHYDEKRDHRRTGSGGFDLNLEITSSNGQSEYNRMRGNGNGNNNSSGNNNNNNNNSGGPNGNRRGGSHRRRGSTRGGGRKVT